jgi:NAD(P)-dependent dehydrogenase (short-subunit alcohol dehydrogenase family)
MSHRGVVVVSGASRGVGRVTAEMLADAGYVVFAGVLDEVEAAAWRDARVAERRIVPVPLNITRQEHLDALSTALDADGRDLPLRALVNVAGLAQFDVIEHVDQKVMRRIFDVNVFGALALAQALLPRIKQSHGRLVFVTSMAARASAPLLGVDRIAARCVTGGTPALGRQRDDGRAGRHSHPHDGRGAGAPA